VCVWVCVCARARAHLKFVMVEGNAYINFEYDIPQRDGLYKKKILSVPTDGGLNIVGLCS